MAPVEIVQFDELARLRVRLRQKAVRGIALRHGNGRPEGRGRGLQDRALDVLGGIRNRVLRENGQIAPRRDHVDPGRVLVRIGDDHRAGVVHAGAELGEQRVQPRVAMRLHHGHDIARAGLTRGLQHGGDLDRVVAIVVHDAHPIHDAGGGETALDAAESGQARADRSRLPD